MKRNHFSLVAGLVLATSMVGPSAKAQVRPRKTRSGAATEDTLHLCLMDSSGTKGLLSVHTLPRFSAIFMDIFGAKIVQSSENCDTDFDDDCDGLVNEDCPTSICGDGIVDPSTEECDEGSDNGSPDSLCSASCTKVSPPQFAFTEIAGEDCLACAADLCADVYDSCIQDPACIASTQCHADSACIHPIGGPISCLCGEATSVTECKALAQSQRNMIDASAFSGACADEIITGIAPGDSWELFRNFVNDKTPIGLANRLYVCMTRNCRDTCEGIFIDKPVCGNGIIEEGELCDNGNLGEDDPCIENCTAIRPEPVIDPA